MRRRLTRLALAAGLALRLWAGEWYVTPDGTAAGDGSKEKPWSLEAALKPHPVIQPMDTVWVRKGIYNGAFVGRLKGAPNRPVVLRAYPGERVVLDGNGYSPKDVLRIEGEWAWYWGLEVMNSDVRRAIGTPGSNTPESRSTGINILGPNVKVINCIVHDAGVAFGFWTPAVDSELYGNLIYNNGWRAPDRTHGHSIYTQNDKGVKLIRDNILFNPFSFNLHLYGSKRAFLNNYRIEGNAGFNGRWLVGGEGPMKNIEMAANLLYKNTAELRYTNRQNEGLTLEGNYLPVATSALWWDKVAARGNTFFRPGSTAAPVEVTASAGHTIRESSFEGNTYLVAGGGQQVARVGDVDTNQTKGYTFSAWQGEMRFDKTGVFRVVKDGRPPEAAVFVRRNAYEPERGHVVIYNWPLLNEVDVDIGVMNPRPGDRWTLRNVQNYFEEAVSGVYEGKPLRVPMTGWTAAVPIGEDKPLYLVTFPEFGVFVLTLERAKPVATAVAADPARRGVGSPGALMRTEAPGFFEGWAVAQGPDYGVDLGGVRVEIEDEGGRRWEARVTAASPAGVTWEMPEGVATGVAKVRLVQGERWFDGGLAEVRDVAPALFSGDGSGTGEALGWVWDGEELRLLATGMRRARGGAWAMVAGREMEVMGVERAEFPGVDVVRVGLPALGAMAGVRVGVGGEASNEVQVGVR